MAIGPRSYASKRSLHKIVYGGGRRMRNCKESNGRGETITEKDGKWYREETSDSPSATSKLSRANQRGSEVALPNWK